MTLFLDSSAIIAVLNRGDHHHEAAARFARAARDVESQHLSNYVLAEVLTRLARRIGAADAAERVGQLLESRANVLHWIQEDLHLEALRLFRAGDQRTLSFTDCTSFALMRRLGLTTAFTFDRDFAAAGFEVVPHA